MDHKEHETVRRLERLASDACGTHVDVLVSDSGNREAPFCFWAKLRFGRRLAMECTNEMLQMTDQQLQGLLRDSYLRATRRQAV